MIGATITGQRDGGKSCHINDLPHSRRDLRCAHHRPVRHRPPDLGIYPQGGEGIAIGGLYGRARVHRDSSLGKFCNF